MSWVDGWGWHAVMDTEPLVAGGVGEIGAVLRIDVKKVVAVHARPFDQAIYVEAGYWEEGYVEEFQEIDLFLSSVPYMSLPTDIQANHPHLPATLGPSTRFLDVLRRGYDFESSLFSGGSVGSRSLPSLGDGLIDNSDDKQDVLQRYNWAGRKWDVYVGEQGHQFADFVLVWPGKSGRNAELDRNTITVPLEDVARRFDQPVQQNTFTPGFEPTVVLDGVDDSIGFGNVLNRGTTTSVVVGCAFITSTLQNAGLYGKKQGRNRINAGYLLSLGAGGAIRIDVADGTTLFSVAPVPPGGYNTGERISVLAIINRADNELSLHWNPNDGTGWSQIGATVDITGLGNLDNVETLFAGRHGGGEFFAGEIERVAQDGFNQFPGNVEAFLDAPFPEDVDTSWAGTQDHVVPMTENLGLTVTDVGAGGHSGTINGVTASTVRWSGLQNGRRELEGVRVPLAYGDLRGDFVDDGINGVRRMRVEPVLLDEIKQVYKWHDGAVESVDHVEDGGLELIQVALGGADFWESEDGPPGSSYWVDFTNGLIRLDAPPARKLTLSGRGSDSPSYVDEPHRILRRIATVHAGIPEPAGFEDAAFTALDGLPSVGVYIQDESIDETFDWLMRSVQGWWAVGRTGLVMVGQLAVPSMSDATVTEDNIVTDSRRRQEMPAPHWRDRVEFARNWAPQTASDVAPINPGTMTARRREVFVRETLFVQDANDLISPTAVGTPFLQSEDVTLDSLLSSRVGAESILALTRSLFATRREVWEIRMPIGILQFWLGDVIEFDAAVPRFDLAGRKFLVIGIRETLTGGVTLTLWG